MHLRSTDVVSDVKKQMVVGAGWMTGLRMGDRLLGVVSIGILARLLLPADFGLVAYATTFYGFLEIFFQFSFEAVLIRERERSRESYNTAWTLNLIKGATVSALIVLGAKPAAALFNEPQVETILYWIAVLPALRGLENIGIVDFQKDLAFNKEFRFHFSVRIIAVVATIIMALMLRSHWALVYGMLLTALLRLPLSYVMSDYRPWFTFSAFTRVFGFSKWLQIQYVLSGLNERIPALLIGRFHSPQALAFFTMSTELLNFGSLELSAPIRRVLFPGFAKIAHDRAQLVEVLRASIGVIVLVALPATVGIAVVTPLFVPFYLGENWIELVPILQVLAANAIVYVVFFSNSNVVYLAIGRPEITAYLSALRFLVLMPTVLIVIPDNGAMGAAWALVATNSLLMIVDYIVVLRMVPLGLTNVITVVWRSVTATSFMAVSVIWLREALDVPDVEMVISLKLAICVAGGILSYSAVVFLLWWLSGKPNDAEAYAIKLLRKSSNRMIGSLQI